MTSDVATGGDLTYTFGPDTLTINPSDYAFNNYLDTPALQADFYNPDGLTSDTYHAVITDPGKFQLTIADEDGTITHAFTTTAIGNSDPGLTAVGGGGVSAGVALAAAVGTQPCIGCVSNDITTYTFGPDTLSINTATDAFNNYLATPNLDVDLYDLGAGSKDYDVVITDPDKFQLTLADDNGTITHSFTTTDISNSDPGLAAITGQLAADVAAGAATDVAAANDVQYTLGPDTLTINPSDNAFDNYLNLTALQVDFYNPDGLTSYTYDVVITDPNTFQLILGDTDGVFTHQLITIPADFIGADPGIADIGGILPVEAAGAAAGDVAGGGLADVLAGLFGGF